MNDDKKELVVIDPREMVMSNDEILRMDFSDSEHYPLIASLGSIALTGGLILAELIVPAGLALVFLGESAFYITFVATSVGGFILGSSFNDMADGILEIPDRLRLKAARKSKNPRKNQYYVNRVLVYLLECDPKHELFNNKDVLSYALWLEYFSDSLRGKGLFNTFKSTRFLKTASMFNFKWLEVKASYDRIAEHMIAGRLEKQMIPVSVSDEENLKRYTDEGFRVRIKKEIMNPPIAPPIAIAQPVMDIKQDYSPELETLNRIGSEWTGVQLDIVQILKYPLFADMRDSLVQDLHTKMEIARSLSTKTLTNDFVIAVASLKTAWNLLNQEARRVELKNFNEGEQRKIMLARDLMDIALNESSSPSERQSAYKKAMEQLNGLVVIPESVTSSLEISLSLKELTS